VQEYLFRLVPGYVDSGKGKCSYDPLRENAVALISETSSCLFIITVPTTVLTYNTNSHHHHPSSSFVPSLLDGNLYAGVHVDFMGTDPAIFRTLGDRPAVRTEQYDSRWLNGELAPLTHR
jgi:semaphorin 3